MFKKTNVKPWRGRNKHKTTHPVSRPVRPVSRPVHPVSMSGVERTDVPLFMEGSPRPPPLILLLSLPPIMSLYMLTTRVSSSLALRI
jgi:hypothetical protein